MSPREPVTIERLTQLAQEKLTLIDDLSRSFVALSDALSADADTEPFFAHQSEIIGRINLINVQYKALTEEYDRLNLDPACELKTLQAIEAEQKQAFIEAARIHEHLVIKAEALKRSLSKSLQRINQSKNVLSQYYPAGKKTGFLMDFKEGK